MSNMIATPERKTITYAPIYTRFAELDEETGEVKAGTFTFLESLEARVLRQDNATVVILNEGVKGVAKCSKGDYFSRRTGLKIAFYRALIEYFEKEIKKLTNGN